MPGVARVVAVGVPHHVAQRGNNRQPIFLDNFDRHWYCKLLGHWSRCRGLGVPGYCWMSNHVPLVVVPERGDALARGFVSPFQGLGNFGDGLPTAERRGLFDRAAPERGSEGAGGLGDSHQVLLLDSGAIGRGVAGKTW